jgi:uncharacterized membrane protein YphA (DoxX/SURF4 family)
MKLRTLPSRLVTGAYILHSGIDKWRGSPEQAAGIHGMASNAFPVLKSIEAPKFLRALSAGEITTGLLLLAPFVPAGLAGAALTGFSGSLVVMYLRTPSLRKSGSIWPSPQGIAVSKDFWMLGIGLDLLIDDAGERHRSSRSS